MWRLELQQCRDHRGVTVSILWALRGLTEVYRSSTTAAELYGFFNVDSGLRFQSSKAIALRRVRNFTSKALSFASASDPSSSILSIIPFRK